MDLKQEITNLFAKTNFTTDDRHIFEDFKSALRRGEIRSAERDADGNWHVNAWVKHGILIGFRMGKMVEMSKVGETFQFFDKDTFPLRPANLGQQRHLRVFQADCLRPI